MHADAERLAHEQAMDEAAGLVRPLADVLADVEAFVRRYVVVTDAQATALALFVAHTHAIDAAETSPYLAVTSAEKRSGKTRLLEVLELLVRAPIRASNVSDAALFRLLAENPRTLLFDEVDAIFNAKGNREDLRALLNAGYRRGAPAWRVVGEGSKMRAEPFEVFGAKVLAGIGALPDTISDRAFPIRLKRKTSAENVERFRSRVARQAAQPIRAQLEAWSTENADRLDAATPELPAELDDRAQDAAEPLLAIAELAGGAWPARGRRALVALRATQAGADDETIGVRLLSDIAAVFERTGDDRLSTERLLELLVEDDEAPWGDWYGKPLSAMRLARLLRPFEVRSRQLRIGDRAGVRGYRIEEFADAFARYIGSQDATPATTAQPSGFAADSKTLQDAACSVLESADLPLNQADVAGVASQTPFPGEEDDSEPVLDDPEPELDLDPEPVLEELLECLVCGSGYEQDERHLERLRCPTCTAGVGA